MPTSKRGTSSPVYQIKVTLDSVRPLIWRRLLVSGHITLYRLHLIIQEAFGWANYHLHLFEINGMRYTQIASDEDWDDVEGADQDDKKFRLLDLDLREKSKFLYTYDFGDGWDHVIMVERIAPPQEGVSVLVCLAGSRACPPEDCGGPNGYGEFLDAIGNPRHKRHDEMMEWIGGRFNPETFDLDETNEGLRKLPK